MTEAGVLMSSITHSVQIISPQPSMQIVWPIQMRNCLNEYNIEYTGMICIIIICVRYLNQTKGAKATTTPGQWDSGWRRLVPVSLHRRWSADLLPKRPWTIYRTWHRGNVNWVSQTVYIVSYWQKSLCRLQSQNLTSAWQCPLRTHCFLNSRLTMRTLLRRATPFQVVSV